MSFAYRYRKEIIIGSIISIFLITIISLCIVYFPNTPKKKQPEKTITLVKKKKTPKLEEKQILYKVDIKGEINNPGIYSMSKGERVIDVIEKAGGLTENANTSPINLSKKVIDEMVIIIYSNIEVKNFKETKIQEQTLQEKCLQKDESSLKNDACIEESKNIPTKISINKATIEELMTLTGIGESKAKDIINYRQTNGEFKTIEELKNVPGIGESIFAKIKENIIT